MGTPVQEGDPVRPDRAAVEKVPTRIHGLDDVLLGGLPMGRTTLVAGGPGTGKTMLGLEFLYRAAHAGEPAVFVTFEERAEAVRQNAWAMGWDLPALEASEKLRVIEAEVPPELVLSGDFSIEGLLAILSGQIQAVGARLVVVDAIDALMRVFQDPLRRQNQLHLLHRWMQDREMTAILTAKSTSDQPDEHPLLDYMADCVIRLDQRIHANVPVRRLRVHKYRGSAFFTNEHPYTIVTGGGLVLMPVETTELVQQQMGPLVSSGNERADAILGGGFHRASSVLISGSSGTGKTTVAASFALAACQRDERVLFVSFEQSEAALVSSMLSPGIELRPALEDGRLRVSTAMPESLGVEDHLLRIFDIEEQFAPDHLIVDAISACHRMGSDKAGFDFLVRLLTRCKERGVTCVCTNQLVEAYGLERISGFGISSLIDTLVLLEQRHVPIYQRRLLVVKSRAMNHSHAHHEFAIRDDGLHFPTPDDEAIETEGSGHGGGR